jgi:hypothetical protein
MAHLFRVGNGVGHHGHGRPGGGCRRGIDRAGPLGRAARRGQSVGLRERRPPPRRPRLPRRRAAPGHRRGQLLFAGRPPRADLPGNQERPSTTTTPTPNIPRRNAPRCSTSSRRTRRASGCWRNARASSRGAAAARSSSTRTTPISAATATAATIIISSRASSRGTASCRR